MKTLSAQAAAQKILDGVKLVWLVEIDADAPNAATATQYYGSRKYTLTNAYTDQLSRNGIQLGWARVRVGGGLASVAKARIALRNEAIVSDLVDLYFLENDEVRVYLVFVNASEVLSDRVPVGQFVIENYPYTERTWILDCIDGSDKDFTYIFPKLKTTDLQIFVDDVLQTVVDDYTHPSNGTVRFGTAPASTKKVEIRRNTVLDVRVTFDNAAVFGETAMNTAYLHALYKLQELQDQLERTVKLHPDLANLVVPLNLAAGGTANMVTSVDRVDTGAGKITQDKAAATLTFQKVTNGFTTVTLEQGAAATSDIIEGEAC